MWGDYYEADGHETRAAEDAMTVRREEFDAQTEALAVLLDVDTELLIERIAGRARAEGRSDDTPETVRNRLRIYNDQTAPVIGFYEDAGKLARVDGVGSMDEITARVLAAIGHSPA